jgi:hypothetical protein
MVWAVFTETALPVHPTIYARNFKNLMQCYANLKAANIGDAAREVLSLAGAANLQTDTAVRSIDLNSTHKGFPCHAGHRWIEGRSRNGPIEKLRNTIDLVVISPMWKCQQFKQEGVKPISLAREIDVSSFDFGRLRHHAICLIPLRLATDRACHSSRQIAPEILQERHAGTRILDQDGAGTMFRCDLSDFAPKIGVLEAGAEHIEKVVVAFDHPPCGADGIVVGIARHHGDVPTLHDAVG